MSLDFDLNKARIFLKYISRSNKKINDRKEAFKKIHEEIKEIKKTSSKTARHRISRLENNIICALKQGGFIIEEQKEDLPKKQLPAEEQSLYLQEKTREKKLKEIESIAVEKSAIESLKNIEFSNITNMLNNLERMRKKIKAINKSEKDRLNNISEKINFLKSKLGIKSSVQKNKIVSKKKRKNKK